MSLRYGKEEFNQVKEVIKSGSLSSFYRNPYGGKKVKEFEEKFAEYYKVSHGISVSSGTAALHTACLALKICGQKVFTTPYSFISSSSTIAIAGGFPHYIDIDRKSLGMRGDLVPSGSTALTVHLLGNPAPKVKNTNYLIEDCCQALGAEIDGKKVGKIGDLGCFSFQETKTITTGGEGGMIITDNEELAERCKRIRNHAEKYFRELYFGYNYRMTEIQAAIGIAQLEKLDMFNKIQIDNGKYIVNNLPEILTPCIVKGSIYYIIGCLLEKNYTVPHPVNDGSLISRRDHILLRLSKWNKGIPGETIGKGYDTIIYNYPAFRSYLINRCYVAEDVLTRSLWFDVHRFNPDKNRMKLFVEDLKEACEE